MRRLSFILVFFLVCCAGAFALDGIVTFMWYENDPNVEYYRYQLDGEEDGKWTVLDWSASEVALEMDISVPHVLYLQQSYDGENWSASSCADSEVYEDTSSDYVEESVEFDFEEETDDFVSDESVADELTPVAEPTDVDDVVFSFDAIEIERYDSMDILDFGLGYLNHVPDSTGPKGVGLSVAYTHSFMGAGFGELCIKANASLDLTENLGLSSYLNALALFSAKIGNCDVFAGIGPEFSCAMINDPYAGFGMAVEAGVRYSRSKTFSVGFALSDHYRLLSSAGLDNRFDARAFLSLGL